MLHRIAVACLLLVPLSGCVDSGDGGIGPPVGPPKMLVNRGPDNLTEVFVRTSVGDVNYTRITLRFDNATEGDPGFHRADHTYALDVKVNRTSFHVNVTVLDRDVRYAYEASVHINTTARTARVVPPDGDPDVRSLPVSVLLDRWRDDDR